VAQPSTHDPRDGNSSELSDDWRKRYPVLLAADIRSDRYNHQQVSALPGRQRHHRLRRHNHLYLHNRQGWASTATDLRPFVPVRDFCRQCSHHQSLPDNFNQHECSLGFCRDDVAVQLWSVCNIDLDSVLLIMCTVHSLLPDKWTPQLGCSSRTLRHGDAPQGSFVGRHDLVCFQHDDRPSHSYCYLGNWLGEFQHPFHHQGQPDSR
jgi:hypothetical protein